MTARATELRRGALAALYLADPVAKVAYVRRLVAAMPAVDPSARIDASGRLASRPSRPVLVDPARVPQRSPQAAPRRAAPRC
jgi:uncharacterized ferritin-like protein (DUF455 family)